MRSVNLMNRMARKGDLEGARKEQSHVESAEHDNEQTRTHTLHVLA
jgi:hypothetical protein